MVRNENIRIVTSPVIIRFVRIICPEALGKLYLSGAEYLRDMIETITHIERKIRKGYIY